jgi:tetratricopeptide (TPR) repeat protein|tara:strand:+ start:119 stop:595 length:477 start_codon:yes stop_codon:yes gene_type:complete
MKIILISLIIWFQAVDNLLDKGYEQYDQGEFTEAVKSFNTAIEIDPNNAESYFLRAMSYQGMALSKLAVADLEKAIVLKTDYAEAFQQLGYIYLVGQAPVLAIEAFDKAILLTPKVAELYINRGSAQCMLGHLEKAAQDYQKAQKMGISYAAYMNCDQ